MLGLGTTPTCNLDLIFSIDPFGMFLTNAFDVCACVYGEFVMRYFLRLFQSLSFIFAQGEGFCWMLSLYFILAGAVPNLAMVEGVDNAKVIDYVITCYDFQKFSSTFILFYKGNIPP